MVYSAKSDDIGTISQFTRIKYIKITTNGSSTPVNYQVKLTIDYEPEMQADFSDIRFNTLENIYIDYWIESKTDSVTATVWVELPDAITDPGSNTIWMHYGNTGLSDGGVGADTFIQYHGAATANFLDTVNVNPTNIIYESRIKQEAYDSRLLFGLSNLADRTDSGVWIRLYPSSPDIKYIHSKKDGSASSKSETYTQDTNYHRYKITNDGTTIRGYDDENEISTGITTNIPTENLALAFWESVDHGTHDWAFIRTYITNEPTPSYGTAQHQRRTPQFIN